MRTNKCEIRCIHNAKGWVRDLTPPPLGCSRSRVVTNPCYSSPPSALFSSPPFPRARLHPPSARCKSIRHAAERYVYCRCIEKQNAPSSTLWKYRGFRSSGIAAQQYYSARVDWWRDETRNSLVVDFSECLRTNRRNGSRRSLSWAFILESDIPGSLREIVFNRTKEFVP